MNTSGIGVDFAGFFSLAGLSGRVRAETQTSISLSVGRLTNMPSECPPGSDSFFASSPEKAYFEETGWIDVHYPCKSGPTVFVRMRIPGFESPEQLDALISELLRGLSIPIHEKCALYYSSDEGECCVLPNDDFSS